MKISIAGCGNMGMIYARAFLKYNILQKEDLLLIEKKSAWWPANSEKVATTKRETRPPTREDFLSVFFVVILYTK